MNHTYKVHTEEAGKSMAMRLLIRSRANGNADSSANEHGLSGKVKLPQGTMAAVDGAVAGPNDPVIIIVDMAQDSQDEAVCVNAA